MEVKMNKKEFMDVAIDLSDDNFEKKIKNILEGKCPDLTEEGYKVAKERDIKKIGKQLKEAYEKAIKS